MKVSIITPSLNSEKFIEYNLKSVHIHQNGDFSVEQIIVDGGSTDQTIDITESFKERHDADITIIQDKDKSMYDAINKGLKIMNGDIWACLNTDDLYNPRIIPLVIEEFKRHPEIDVVYGYLDRIDENGNFLVTSYLPKKIDLKLLILAQSTWCIYQPSTFLRTTVIDKVGYFDIKYKYASDYDYLIRVAGKCKMKLLHKSFTKYRKHSNALSVNPKTASTLNKEAEEISTGYMDELGIMQKNSFLDHLRLYVIRKRLSLIQRISKFCHNQLD